MYLIFYSSQKFEGQKLIQRHRVVNQLVKEKLLEKFPHALSIEAKTIEEWDPNYKVPEASPNCRGGFGK
jgi:stress-induced morphogen